jgi:hypothetical protein
MLTSAQDGRTIENPELVTGGVMLGKIKIQNENIQKGQRMSINVRNVAASQSAGGIRFDIYPMRKCYMYRSDLCVASRQFF